MSPNPQANASQPNQQKGQPDIRAQNPNANKQAFGQQGKPGFGTQKPSARPQDSDDENTGGSCATGKDSSCASGKDKKTAM